MSALVIATLKETAADEHRVAIDPTVAAKFVSAGNTVLVEKDAGKGAFFTDAAYQKAGATIASRDEIISKASIIAVIHRPDDDTLKKLSAGQVIIGLLEPLVRPDIAALLNQKKVTSLAFELLPRTVSRAQTMDVLSSQASVAGYRAAIVAAEAFSRYFPMMITAAGTAKPANVLVLGTGVAGLQAIGTAKRLGAVVSGYDVRPASRGEVESLGATFLTSSVTGGAGAGGYARALSAEEQAKQQAELASYIQKNDIVITTAQVPGRKPPLLVSKSVVATMKPGSIFIDLAASSLGGNVEGSEPGKRVVTADGVTLVGAGNLASELPSSASSMFSKNVQALITAITKDGALAINPDDEVQSEVLVTYGGEVIGNRLRDVLKLPKRVIKKEETAPAPTKPVAPVEKKEK